MLARGPSPRRHAGGAAANARLARGAMTVKSDVNGPAGTAIACRISAAVRREKVEVWRLECLLSMVPCSC
jgi:hypothetical protein